MPQKTQTYKLDYFKQGSYYSASSDYRRFVTMDYNMESYIGIIGVGVIEGWTIDIVNGLTVQILPGSGIINGFFSESPYTVKQRSDMVAGDREIGVLNEDNVPELPLTPTQRANYVAVIQLYDPSFNPVGDIENSYVKVVVPEQIVLLNNADTYIYAQRPTGATPYPVLADYPPLPGSPPNRNDYSDYDSYREAMDIYEAKLEAIHNYEWYANPDNHFTAVEFVTSSSNIKTSSKVLLGRVITRSNSVSNIDLSGVDTLANLESQIKQVATEYLVEHKHGGNKPFDPPKVRLETDIRDTALSQYNPANNRLVYSVLERETTGISLGHKHTYSIDSDGNGQTIGMIGTAVPHFHEIAEFVVGDPALTVDALQAHTHTLPSTSSADTWDSTTSFVVYVNDSILGDETTPYIHADPTTQTISFDKGVSISNSKYSVSFSANVTNPATGEPTVLNYSYSARDVSVYHFMITMMMDYDNTYRDFYTPADESNSASVALAYANYANHPFVFPTFDSTGEVTGVAGVTDLKNQSSAAQSLLKVEGAQFMFTPDAARNIPLTLVEVGHIDEVRVEFLGNTEVSGKLKPENILYLNANKILTGQFIPEVIPFVSHVGRMKEECFPLQYVMISNDGIRYSVVPTITDIALGHYHKLLVDKQATGATTDMMISNDVIYYQNDNDGNTYFVYHAHGSQSGEVSPAGTDQLMNWYNNVSSSTISSPSHVHNIIYPVIGNEKTIYAIKEDIEGNIYVGTSDGFMIIPQSPSYQFVVNGVELYFYGNDLWSLLEKVQAQYEVETGNPIIINESIYGDQLAKADLTSDGDSVLLVGTPYPNRPTDNIMIKRISSFALPNFGYVVTKPISKVLPTETVISTNNSSTPVTVVVERNFNDVPIWSIELDTNVSTSQNYIASNISTDILLTGSNLLVKSVGLNKTPYQPWTPTDLPFAINVIRKTIKDADGNYWACTNNGILVSRSYSAGDIFEFASLPGGYPNVQDIINGERDAIYCASAWGIFKTLDEGKTWTRLLNVIGGFTQIVRDRSLDKSTTVNGHYHEFDVDNSGSGFLGESIGTGIKHVHIVTDWNVADTMGHTHTMLVTLYAVDSDKIIWKSVDNGQNWVQYGSLPEGECGSLFAAFGYLFVSQSGGLYKSTDGSSWSNVISSKAYSYEWSYDMSELLIGSNNILYGTVDGTSFYSVYEFNGKPSVILLNSGSQQYFGYAYSNVSQNFHFKDSVFSGTNLAAIVDFDKWYAQGGSWQTSDPYDVYINYKLALSTKSGKDNRDVLGYHFTVNPSDGSLDFGATTEIAKQVDIYDSVVEVANTSGFSTGDSIVVMSNTGSLYSNIEAINGNVLTLDSPSSQVILVPSAVKKIPLLDGQSNILVNVYDSALSNVGSFTHEQVENGLSNYSDGRPYKFNDTYLSNLLQLTQAIRYVYPDINSEFINNMFYDFRYSWNPSDPIYPSIYDYIDIVTSDIYNQKVYDNNFVGQWAKSINAILVGFGPFSGKILVATDIGIFISELTASFEANWFYVSDLPYSVYDLMIYESDVLYAATSNGTYYSQDLKTWTLESNPPIAYPSYSLGLRWFDKLNYTVPPHEAYFIPNSTTNIGIINAASGTPYQNLNANQGIKITGAGDKNGNYIISAVGDNGAGLGSQISVSPSFSGIAELKTGVVITMGTWWGQWNGDINTANANITNTLLVGGEDHISYNDGGDAWYESSFNGVSQFISRKFLPLTNGRLLLAATGTNASSQKNYLLKSDDIGKQWSLFRSFEEVKGKITSVSVSEFNNTVLKVNYTQPENYVYINGILDQQEIGVFSPNSTIAIFRGTVVWNENRDGSDTITVFGNSMATAIANNTNYTFIVYPSKVNTMTESDQQTLFFGTNKGIYYDVDTVVNNVYIEGSVANAGINATVQQIDVSGSIVSLSIDSVTNNTVLFVVTDTPIRGGDLEGKFLYITDTDPVEKYEIVTNTSLAPGEELSIQIMVETALSSAYIGKKFRILGEQSRIYVNYDLPVSDNQFNGGSVTIASNEYNNIGTKYNVVSNLGNYIDLDVALIPSTTLVSNNAIIDGIPVSNNASNETSNEITPLQVGQNIRLLDSSEKLTLWITLNRAVKQNSLKDLVLEISTPLQGNATSSTIDTNLKNSVSLEVTDSILNFSKGDSFVIKGALYEQLGGFSHLKTSVDSDHHHDVETVNAIVSGSIQSFSNVSASYVDLNVTDTQNFNIPIVQYNGDLFKGAQIVFTTPESVNLRYISEVVSHTPTSIKVRIKSASYWDFTSASSLYVSEGWQWEIDGTNYGYTNGITYDDFVVLTSGITATANRASNQLKVTSTTGINVGDRLRIQDSTLSYEINTVDAVVDAVTLQVSTALSRTYFIQNNPQIKVLRDVFANTHIHQIRNNEVQPLIISEYLDNGYPADHSHRVLPLVTDVSVLLNQNNSVTALGSSSIIYRSTDNGLTWAEVVDLNDFLEGSDEVNGISSAILNNDKLIVGATNGNLFVQTDTKNMIIGLSSPI